VAKNNGMKAARPLREIVATIETVRADGGVIGREGMYTLLDLLGAGDRLDAQFHNLKDRQHLPSERARGPRRRRLDSRPTRQRLSPTPTGATRSLRISASRAHQTRRSLCDARRHPRRQRWRIASVRGVKIIDDQAAATVCAALKWR
jgi:hypothetical protein